MTNYMDAALFVEGAKKLITRLISRLTNFDWVMAEFAAGWRLAIFTFYHHIAFVLHIHTTMHSRFNFYFV